jgi:hypothetical protein
MQQRGERHIERMAGVSERGVDHIETLDGKWAKFFYYAPNHGDICRRATTFHLHGRAGCTSKSARIVSCL